MAKAAIVCGTDGCTILEPPEGYTFEQALELGILREAKEHEPKQKQTKRYWQNKE